MKRYKGICHCEQHGDFEWRTYELEHGEVATFRVDDVQKNCDRHYVDPISGVCHVTVHCPKCFKKFQTTDSA